MLNAWFSFSPRKIGSLGGKLLHGVSQLATSRAATELLLKLVVRVPQHLSSLEARKEQRPGMNISDPSSG